MFEHFSVRAKQALFLARELASTRGATNAVEPFHLLEALVREDQGEFARSMPNVARIGTLKLGTAHPFFPAETASAVLVSIERVLPPKADPVLFSTDMPLSAGLGQVFTAAKELADQLHHKEVEPLHLLAVMTAQESTGAGEVLQQAGVSREAVVAALRS